MSGSIAVIHHLHPRHRRYDLTRLCPFAWHCDEKTMLYLGSGGARDLGGIDVIAGAWFFTRLLLPKADRQQPVKPRFNGLREKG